MTDKKLIPLYLSIFLLHTLLMSSFVVIPLILRDQAGIDTAQLWRIYLPVLLVSGILMMPFLILGEKFNKIRLFFCGAVLLMLLAQSGFYLWHVSTIHIALLLTVFFLAFNYLEAILPALISKLAPPATKGTALGIYSTSQFIGTFCGGLAGGHLYGRFGLGGVFLFGGIVSLIWLIILLIMQDPIQHNSL